MSSARIAYFVNHYPKISHTFIRREITALERNGVSVQRIALRGWGEILPDVEDVAEQERTHYVLRHGLPVLAADAAKLMFRRPLRFAKALKLTAKMSRRADRPWPYHLVYLAEACRLVGWIKQFNIGHIHAHFGTNSTEVVMLASELSGVPYSFTVHGCEEFDKPESIGLPEKIRRSKFVVAISSFARAQLYRWSDCISWKKVNVVHCALDPAYYRNSPPPILDRPRLLCIGRLCKEKGLPLLLMATAMLVKKGCTVELVLAGDGEMRAEIESLIVSNDLCGHVKITGWVDANRIRQELQNCRALVLASFAEGLPVVIMEALALGRPVLTTRIAGIPELVVHGKNGWLVPPGSVDALAEAMEECLTTPVAHLEKMGAWGRELVLQRHNDDHEAKKLVALFGFSPTTTSI